MNACRICGCDTLRHLFTVGKWQIEECSGCGTRQVQDPPPAEELAAIYDDDYFTHSKYANPKADLIEQQRRLRIMAPAKLREGARLLDVGCATGEFLRAASSHYEVWGTDVTSAALTRVGEKSPELADRLVLGPVEDLPFEAGTFDVLTLWDIIEHLEYPGRAFSAAARLLRPGGWLFVSTPDAGALTARQLGRRWAFMTPPEHLTFLTAKALRISLCRNGFEPIRLTARGKWVNLGFLVYKLARIYPSLVPQRFVRYVSERPLGGKMIYIPTGDVMYIAAYKTGGTTTLATQTPQE